MLFQAISQSKKKELPLVCSGNFVYSGLLGVIYV
jgi:hypothetical protein